MSNYKSIFDIGIIPVKEFSHWNNELKGLINQILSVRYLSDPVYKTTNMIFSKEWKDLMILETIDSEVLSEGLTSQASNLGIEWVPSERYLQSMEIIYNIFNVSRNLFQIYNMLTIKAQSFLRIFKIIESVVSEIGYEFIEIKYEDKIEIISNNKYGEILFPAEIKFFRLVSKISSTSKKIIVKKTYYEMYEEYFTSSTSISRKSKILNGLSEIVDGQEKAVANFYNNGIKNKLFNNLNNLNIRHNNFSPKSKHYNPDFVKMSPSILQSEYDWILNIMISYWISLSKDDLPIQ